MRRAAPRGGPSAEKPRPVTAASRRRSGADLRASGDPGHGSGRPRLMARHRITSFPLLRREAHHRGAAASATSSLFVEVALAPCRASVKMAEALAICLKGVTMRRSEERILTTHTGSLPRPPELTRLYVRRARGESVDPAELDRLGRT